MNVLTSWGSRSWFHARLTRVAYQREVRSRKRSIRKSSAQELERIDGCFVVEDNFSVRHKSSAARARQIQGIEIVNPLEPCGLEGGPHCPTIIASVAVCISRE